MFDWIGDFEYIVYVSLYPQQYPQAEVTLAESEAELKVFSPYHSWPSLSFQIPAHQPDSRYTYWSVFCLSGKNGLKKLSPLNSLSYEAPDVSSCSQIYGQRNTFPNSIAEPLKGESP